MTVTISEIAKRAGVSRSTVSRALQDHPRIREDTKARIRKIAEELGYVPNYIAQSLSVRRTLTFGMVITGVNNPFTWKVVEGVDVTAHSLGYSVLFSTSRNEQEHELEVIESFRRRRVDGIIVISSHMGSTYADHLGEIDIPVVLINHQESSEKLHTVRIDDYAGASLAVEHLLGLSHRRIAYVGTNDRIGSDRRRYAAYHDLVTAAGLMPIALYTDGDTANDFKTGHILAIPVIESNVTAVFCYNDRIALGLIAGLREHGIAVPNQISIASFDDIDESQYASPTLTTVRQPQFQLGQQAVELLFELMEDNEQVVQDRILTCELIVRESTHAPIEPA